jgi:hypothetical protein
VFERVLSSLQCWRVTHRLICCVAKPEDFSTFSHICTSFTAVHALVLAIQHAFVTFAILFLVQPCVMITTVDLCVPCAKHMGICAYNHNHQLISCTRLLSMINKDSPRMCIHHLHGPLNYYPSVHTIHSFTQTINLWAPPPVSAADHRSHW